MRTFFTLRASPLIEQEILNSGPARLNQFVARSAGQAGSGEIVRYQLRHPPGFSSILPRLPSSISKWATSSSPDFLRDGSIIYPRWVAHPGQNDTYAFSRWDAVASATGNHVIQDLGAFPARPDQIAASPTRDEVFVQTYPIAGEIQYGLHTKLRRFNTLSGVTTLIYEPRITPASNPNGWVADAMQLQDVAPDGDDVLVAETEYYDGPQYGPDNTPPLNPTEVRQWQKTYLKVVPREGGSASTLVESARGDRITAARFSPDGREVAWINNPWSGPPQLHLMELGGGNHRSWVVRTRNHVNGVWVDVDAAQANQLAWMPVYLQSGFDITPDAAHPGRFKVQSRAESDQFEGLRLAWDFGNGDDDRDGFIETVDYTERRLSTRVRPGWLVIQ